MADDQKLEVLEEEIKVLKGEVRRTLVDLRALVMRADSPLNDGSIGRRAAKAEPAPEEAAPATKKELAETVPPPPPVTQPIPEAVENPAPGPGPGPGIASSRTSCGHATWHTSRDAHAGAADVACGARVPASAPTSAAGTGPTAGGSRFRSGRTDVKDGGPGAEDGGTGPEAR